MTTTPFIELLELFIIPGVLVVAGIISVAVLDDVAKKEKSDRRSNDDRLGSRIEYAEKLIYQTQETFDKRLKALEAAVENKYAANIERTCPECEEYKSFPEYDYLCNDCRKDDEETS